MYIWFHSTLKLGTAMGETEDHCFCRQSAQHICYQSRMCTASVCPQWESRAIASSRLSLRDTILLTKSPAEEVVPWATPNIEAVTMRRRVIITGAAARVDVMVALSGAVKVLASVSNGAAPPPTARACFAAQASSSFRTAMVC